MTTEYPFGSLLTIQMPRYLRRLSGSQVESIFAEIHSRVEQEADARKIVARVWVRKGREAKGQKVEVEKEEERAKERVANRAPGATNRISESRP